MIDQKSFVLSNDNKFLGLPIEETSEIAADTPDIPAVVSCPTKGKTQKLCVQCGQIHKQLSQFCQNCDDAIFSNILAHDLKDDHRVPDIQILSQKAFVRRGKRREFAFVGMMQFDHGQKFDGQFNFTHHATLGGGDDADAQSAGIGKLGDETL